MEVLDLSVAGLKVRFDSVFGNVRLREEQFNWLDSRFRFFLNGKFFILSGYFLKIYRPFTGKSVQAGGAVPRLPQENLLQRVLADWDVDDIHNLTRLLHALAAGVRP